MLCKLEIVKVKIYLQNSNKKFNKTMEEKIVLKDQKNTQSDGTGTYIHCPGTDFQRNYMTLQRKLFKFI